MQDSEPSSDTLVVYTYDSLLAWGIDGEEKLNNLLADFTKDEGINVNLLHFVYVWPLAVEATQNALQSAQETLLFYWLLGKNIIPTGAGFPNQ